VRVGEVLALWCDHLVRHVVGIRYTLASAEQPADAPATRRRAELERTLCMMDALADATEALADQIRAARKELAERGSREIERRRQVAVSRCEKDLQPPLLLCLHAKSALFEPTELAAGW
jgi:hypothetical protein